MTRHYADATEHQNGASITAGSLTLTVGALLQGHGLSGLPAPYTVRVCKIDGTNAEEMDVTASGSYPTVTVTRGINNTTAVSHDTTEIITQVVGVNDLTNLGQLDGAQQAGQFNVTGPIKSGGAQLGIATPPSRLWGQSISPGAPATGLTSTVMADTAYNAFPGLCVTRSGKLIASYREGTAHLSLNGKVTIQTSTDGGATWSGKTYLASPAAGHDYRGPSLTCLSTGRIVLVFFDNPGDTATACVTYVMYSDDDGATWSSPAAVAGFSSWSAHGGPILQHSSGVLLLPIYGQNSGDTGGEAFDRVGVLRSLDNGLTWSTVVNIGGADTALSEIGLVEYPDHSITAYIRHNVYPGTPYTSKSTDGGLTWTTPVAMSITTANAQPAMGLVPVSQELIMFNGDKDTVPINQNKAAYWYSTDLGATWSAQTVIGSNTFEYAAVCPLADHLLGIIYCQEVSSSQADVHFLIMAFGLPVVSGSQNGNPAVASLLAALVKQGEVIDTSTTGTAATPNVYAPLTSGVEPIQLVSDGVGNVILAPFM